MADIRLYVYTGYGSLAKTGNTVNIHKFKHSSDAKAYVGRRRARGIWTSTQFVLIEYFKNKNSKIIEIIEPLN